MADPGETAAILKRALEYPYATPDRSYLYRDGDAHELPEDGPDLTGRTPLLSYGANAAPEVLARKLAPVAVAARAGDFDVVYSAHVSPYGAVPATLRAARTVAPRPRPRAADLLTATEPNYD